MRKLNKVGNQVSGHIPLTAEAREIMLDSMFADDLPHHGELFIPDDRFYTNQQGEQRAEHMLVMLCHWLGIKPGYIGLAFEGRKHKIADGQRHTFSINNAVLENEFLLGRVLAYGLTRYLIEKRKRMRLDGNDQTALFATASVMFGFGIVVINGAMPSNRLLHYIKRLVGTSAEESEFSHSFDANYNYLLRGFLRSHNISAIAYNHTLTPWAAKELNIKLPRKSTYAAREAKHTMRVSNLKKVGLLWLAILITGLSVFVVINRTRPESTNSAQDRLRAEKLATEINTCKDSLAYQQQYADLADIQTVRNLNAMGLKCQSLENEYRAALH